MWKAKEALYRQYDVVYIGSFYWFNLYIFGGFEMAKKKPEEIKFLERKFGGFLGEVITWKSFFNPETVVVIAVVLEFIVCVIAGVLSFICKLEVFSTAFYIGLIFFFISFFTILPGIEFFYWKLALTESGAIILAPGLHKYKRGFSYSEIFVFGPDDFKNSREIYKLMLTSRRILIAILGALGLIIIVFSVMDSLPHLKTPLDVTSFCLAILAAIPYIVITLGLPLQKKVVFMRDSKVLFEVYGIRRLKILEEIKRFAEQKET